MNKDVQTRYFHGIMKGIKPATNVAIVPNIVVSS